jgi:hypothetical protein
MESMEVMRKWTREKRHIRMREKVLHGGASARDIPFMHTHGLFLQSGALETHS